MSDWKNDAIPVSDPSKHWRDEAIVAPHEEDKDSFSARHPVLSNALELSAMATMPEQYMAYKNAPDQLREVQKDPGRAMRTMGEQTANTLLMGHLPQVEAGVGQGVDKASQLLGVGSHAADADLESRGIAPPQGDDYVTSRDKTIQRMKSDSDAFPESHTAGTVLGSGILAAPGLAGTLRGGAALAAQAPSRFMQALDKVPRLAELAKQSPRAAALIESMLKGGALGGAYGAAVNPGDTPGEVSPLQAGARAAGGAKGAGWGSLLGGLITGGGQLLGGGGAPGSGGAANGLGEFAEEKAVKAAGAFKPDMKRVNAKGIKNDMGRTLLEGDAWTPDPNAGWSDRPELGATVQPLSSTGTVAQRLDKKIGEKTQALDDLIQGAETQISDKGFWSVLPPADKAKIMAASYRPAEQAKLLKDALRARYSQIPEEKLQPAFDEIDSWLGSKGPVMGIRGTQDMKTQMNSFLKDSDFYKEPGIKKMGTLGVRKSLKEGVEKKADALADVLGEEGGDIRDTNRTLSHLYEAQDIAQGRMAGDEGNRLFSLTDHGVGGAAGIGSAASGHAPLESTLIGAAAATANKALRTYGNSTMAGGADQLAKLLRSAPGLAKVISENPAAIPLLLQRMGLKPPEMKAGPQNEAAPPHLLGKDDDQPATGRMPTSSEGARKQFLDGN